MTSSKFVAFALTLIGCWIVTGAAIFAWSSFVTAGTLTGRQTVAVLTLEFALVLSVLLWQYSCTLVRVRVKALLDPDFGSDGQETSRVTALEYCDEELAFYDVVSSINFGQWRILVSAGIVLGSIGTLLSSINSTSYWLLVARSVAVAGATIVTALNTTFRHQQESLRQAATADSLRGERIMFCTKVKPYDSTDAPEQFVTRVRAIIESENKTWVATNSQKDATATS